MLNFTRKKDVLRYLGCFVLCCMCMVQVATAQCGCANCPVSLPDDTEVEFAGAIVVYNEANDLLGVNNTLEQVCIDIDHTFIGDLDITLYAPDGTSVVLYADGNNNTNLGGTESCPCGNPNNDMNVCFTLPGTTQNIFGTEGTGNCTDEGYSDPCNGGTLCYTGNWGTWNEGCEGGNGIDEFNNGSGTVSGTWIILINDNAGFDEGVINDISLGFTSTVDSCFSLPPPPVPPCTNQTVVSVPDNTGTPGFSTINNTGSVGTMGAGTELLQVCVLIDHTFIGDLDLYLYEPDGSGVLLSGSNGGASDDYGDVSNGIQVCFSPTATNPITAYAGGQTGVWQPEGNLNDFDGPPNGDWQLLVWDNVGIDNGSILSWSIELSTGDCAADCTVRSSISASICTGFTYDFNDNPITTGGVYHDTIPLNNGCDSIITLTLEELPIITNDIAFIICEGDSSTINGFDYYDSTGTYIDTIFRALCDSVVTLDLVVELIQFSSSNISLCPGDSAILPDGMVTYGSGIFVNTIAGYYCDSVVTSNITLNVQHDTSFYFTTCFPADSGTVVEQLTNVFGCDSIVTTRTDLVPSDSGGYFATTCDSLMAGTETLVFQNQYGCDSLVTVITQIGPNTSSVIATTCDPIMAGISMDTFTNITGCDSLVTTQTLLLPTHTINLASLTCQESAAGFESNQFINQYGCDSIVNITTDLLVSHHLTDHAITCDLSEVGSVDAIFTNVFGCDSIITTVTSLADTMEVHVSPAVSSILFGEMIELSVDPAHGQINWLPELYLTCDTCANVISTPPHNIIYIVKRSIQDCMAYDTVRIDVSQPQAFIPSAFSPNGDRHNDEFMLIPAFIDEIFAFRIYNRWGELLFETLDLNVGWNGVFNGQEQEVDGYVYYLDVVLITGERIRQSDLFFLIR